MMLEIAPDIDLPTELATRRSAIFGISGSGKSNTATRAIEELLRAGEQVILIDPKGEGWGLQTSADGQRPGFDVIVFGQPRGDIPELREEHAAELADFAVESGRSIVLSLLGFESDQAERRFVTEFFKRLYRRKSQQVAKTRTLVVLEEAHLFVPEQASGVSGEMVGAIKRIARQGRSAGIGLMVVDQRPQEVAKSIISQCELLICHQLVHKLDRDALREWVRAYDQAGQGETFLNSLAALKPGEAWVWSPAWLHLFVRTRVNRRQTYDSGATPDGSPATAPTAKAAVDLEALRTHLAKVIEEAKAEDPAMLKKAIAELRKQLAAKPAAQVEIREVFTPAISPADLARLEAIADGMKAQSGRAHDLQVWLAACAEDIKQVAANAPRQDGQATAAEVQQYHCVAASSQVHALKEVGKDLPRGRLVSIQPLDKTMATAARAALTGPELRILDAIAWFESIGVAQPEVSAVAFMANYAADGGAFKNPRGSLRQKGMIEYEGRNQLILTDAGRKIASRPTRPKSLAKFHEQIKAVLPGPEQKILTLLLARYPNALPNPSLAQAAGYAETGGAFKNPRGRLKTLGLIEYTRDGGVRARDILFPKGLK